MTDTKKPRKQNEVNRIQRQLKSNKQVLKELDKMIQSLDKFGQFPNIKSELEETFLNIRQMLEADRNGLKKQLDDELTK